jgi:uncharacterized damage-inducible protein DinB
MEIRKAKKLLKPVGERLPWYQHMILRFYMGPFVAGKAGAKQNAEAFNKINSKILSLLDDIPPEMYSTRVLVPPQPALEDDSRYWSISMTLDHLISTHKVFMGIIRGLARGNPKVPALNMDEVKPTSERTPAQVVAEYRALVTTCMKDLETVMDTADPTATQEHPWFGEFTALQWHWLMAAHTAIHYKQLKGIRAGLPFETNG